MHVNVCACVCTHAHTHTHAFCMTLNMTLQSQTSLAFQPLTKCWLAELGWGSFAASHWSFRGRAGEPKRSRVDTCPIVSAAGTAELRGRHSQDEAPDLGSQCRVLSAAARLWRNSGRKLRHIFIIFSPSRSGAGAISDSRLLC